MMQAQEKAVNIIKTFAAQMEWKMPKPKKGKGHIHVSNILGTLDDIINTQLESSLGVQPADSISQ